jgi:hypothetical protein
VVGVDGFVERRHCGKLKSLRVFAKTKMLRDEQRKWRRWTIGAFVEERW